ncbi:hypothetical protein [Bacillus cereus group sp. MYBK104-1]|uniref:hypothetical protein n=1 Tax=unclassified Bacillus cereus group TaxID=2750818 RepID=UPI003F7A0EAF
MNIYIQRRKVLLFWFKTKISIKISFCTGKPQMRMSHLDISKVAYRKDSCEYRFVASNSK